LLLEKLAHQPQRRPSVAPALNQHVEDLAFMVDGTLEIHAYTGDPDHHLVQMPSIAWPRPTLAQPSRNRRAELQHPTPHRFIGDIEPALGEQFLHVAVAQRKAEIEPDRVLDDLGRKTMAAIAEWSHAATLTLRTALARPVSVTKPASPVPPGGYRPTPFGVDRHSFIPPQTATRCSVPLGCVA
jgi:hypothetical protein